MTWLLHYFATGSALQKHTSAAMHKWADPHEFAKLMKGARMSAGPVPYPQTLGLRGKEVRKPTAVLTYPLHSGDALHADKQNINEHMREGFMV